MSVRIWMPVVALAIGACSSRSAPAPATGRVIVALTIDWEGAYLSPEGLDALEQLRTRFAGAPLTHYISAAYFTKQEQDPKAVSWIQEAVQQGDELAVHLHAWRTLARRVGSSPSSPRRSSAAPTS